MASLCKSTPASRTVVGRRQATITCAWTKVATKADIASAGGRKVVEVGGQRILVADDGSGNIKAVSNKCSHLGLPLVGKTALLQGKVSNGCITCPAHGTSFSLATGEVQGKWCPSLPEAVATGFGLTPKKPLPTFPCRVSESGEIEVDA